MSRENHEEMNRQQILNSLRKERARWEAQLDEIGRENMNETGVAGKWSIRELISEISWGERETTKMLQTCVT